MLGKEHIFYRKERDPDPVPDQPEFDNPDLHQISPEFELGYMSVLYDVCTIVQCICTVCTIVQCICTYCMYNCTVHMYCMYTTHRISIQRVGKRGDGALLP